MEGLDEKGVISACPQCGQRNRIGFAQLLNRVRCGKCGTELPPPAAPMAIGTEAQFDALVGRSAVPVLVDFWAEWCGPCKMLAPELSKLAAATAGELIVVKVNTEAAPAMAQRYRIHSIPTLVLFAGGTEVARTSGVQPASALRDFVTRSVGAAAGR